MHRLPLSLHLGTAAFCEVWLPHLGPHRQPQHLLRPLRQALHHPEQSFFSHYIFPDQFCPHQLSLKKKICGMSHTVWALVINCFKLHTTISHIISKLHGKNKDNIICFCMPHPTWHRIHPKCRCKEYLMSNC